MSRSTLQTRRILAICGTIACACTLIGTYVYFSNSAPVVDAVRAKKRVIVTSRSAEELLEFLSEQPEVSDEVYCALYSDAGEPELSRPEEATMAALKARTTHVIRHEKREGVIHITRHISPDLIVVLPTMSEDFNTSQINQWVGQVAILSDVHSQETTGSRGVRFYSTTATYAEVLSSA